MASPLNLTNYNGIYYNKNNQNIDSTSDYTGQYNSIFNGSKFYFRPPNMSNNTNTQSKLLSTRMHQSTVGNSDLYDISTDSIIDYTNQIINGSFKPMKLNPSDFAYLRNLGVYPNNRLAVIRRFPSPVENDLTAVEMEPISKIVTWIPDDLDNIMEFKLDEGWQENDDYDLVGLFDEIIKSSLGISAKGAASGGRQAAESVIPFPGFADAIQIGIINKLLGNENEEGTNFRYDNLPSGNPNFLHKSSFRAQNSLNSDVSFTLNAVYEQKFINGVDPTLVFLDIINNILRFSSSESIFYVTQTGSKKINELFNKFKKGDWVGAIGQIFDAIIDAFKELIEGVKETLETIDFSDRDSIQEGIKSGLQFIGRSTLAKYRIHFSRILPALTGAASGPWHLTIGNPKRPFFSSGDMVVTGTTVKFGNTLSFNDLPNRVEIEFTIKSARPLGIQEIFDKFNTGAGRQYQRGDDERDGAYTTETDFYSGRITMNNEDTTNPVTGNENTTNPVSGAIRGRGAQFN